jgi:AcrR family transcriptional regulator
MCATATTRATPRRAGRPRSEAATTAVLDAAYRLSADLGLRGASMQAIASASGVSKMTVYKWWPSRLHLLIDAYLRQATLLLPMSEAAPPLEAIQAHALGYLAALQGDLGRVQLAVLAECMAEHGNAELFVERYLRRRRDLGVRVIRRGQRDGSITADRPAEALYDQIYGAIFYRCQFGLGGLHRAFVASLIAAVLQPGAGSTSGVGGR